MNKYSIGEYKSKALKLHRFTDKHLCKICRKLCCRVVTFPTTMGNGITNILLFFFEYTHTSFDTQVVELCKQGTNLKSSTN